MLAASGVSPACGSGPLQAWKRENNPERLGQGLTWSLKATQGPVPWQGFSDFLPGTQALDPRLDRRGLLGLDPRLDCRGLLGQGHSKLPVPWGLDCSGVPGGPGCPSGCGEIFLPLMKHSVQWRKSRKPSWKWRQMLDLKWVGECIQSDGWDVPWRGSKSVLFLKMLFI